MGNRYRPLALQHRAHPSPLNYRIRGCSNHSTIARNAGNRPGETRLRRQVIVVTHNANLVTEERITSRFPLYQWWTGRSNYKSLRMRHPRRRRGCFPATRKAPAGRHRPTMCTYPTTLDGIVRLPPCAQIRPYATLDLDYTTMM